jgi:hypothetical protein
MYTILFSAGALAVTELSRVRLRPYAIIIITILLIVGGGIFLPAVTPLLPPSVTQHYLAALGLHFNLESGKMNERLPQWLADRLGWEELAVDVAHVYYSMPEEERRTTMIISTNYGEAGALELYGARLGLPHVYATHNSYHAWGPPPDSVKTLIAVFVSRRDLETHFDSVETTSVHTCSECTRPQSRIPIYIVRNPRFLFSKEWQSFKIYD